MLGKAEDPDGDAIMMPTPKEIMSRMKTYCLRPAKDPVISGSFV